jgi:DNA-directed RNA polymerase subunit RPC12/RpoP
MKKCTKCAKKLPLTDFWKDKTKKGGFYSSCKSCYRKLHGTKEQDRDIVDYYKGKPVTRRIHDSYLWYGNKRLHRHLMEEFIGRKLETSEHVHHIDGNKKNNKLENLIILNKRMHHLIHKPKKDEETISARCINCSSIKYMPKNYILNKYNGNKEMAKFYKCSKCGGGGRKTNKIRNLVKKEQENEIYNK